jgi:TolB protein
VKTIRASVGARASSRAAGLLLVLALAACADPAPGPCAFTSAGAAWLSFSSTSSGNYDLWALRADGSCLAQLTSDPADDLFGSWSRSGTVAFMSRRGGGKQLWLHDLASGAEWPLDFGALEATSPAFSPDGERLAFEGQPTGAGTTTDIYVVAASGGTPVKLTSGAGLNARPAWSPEGATIYFVSNRGGIYNVWKVPAAGGTEEMVTPTTGVLGGPAVSPDGLSLAYTLPGSGGSLSAVVLHDLASGARRVVTNQFDSEPAFDPTGQTLVVTSFRGGNADLWLLDVASGAAIRQLTTSTFHDGAAAFALR